jgi:hypothetical protein
MIEVGAEDITAAGELAAEGPIEGTKFNLHVFTNDKQNPLAIKQLEMFYQATLGSRIGLMHAKNTATGKIDTLLVGVDYAEDGVNTYPLAKLLGEEDMNVYLPPDGEGGYIDNSTQELTLN